MIVVLSCYRYAIMKECWCQDPADRPAFVDLVNRLELIINPTKKTTPSTSYSEEPLYVNIFECMRSESQEGRRREKPIPRKKGGKTKKLAPPSKSPELLPETPGEDVAQKDNTEPEVQRTADPVENGSQEIKDKEIVNSDTKNSQSEDEENKIAKTLDQSNDKETTIEQIGDQANGEEKETKEV